MEFILGADALADKVYEYTKASLERLLDAGAYPDMVQIGNEIGCGLLWDYGTMEHPENIAKRFQKPVVVAETAFPYTDESTNAIANVVGEELTMKELGLRATPQNQRSVLEEVIRTVDREPNGYGVFYWEPVWYSRAGVGVMKGMDNEWENQAVFDKNGKAVEGLHAFEVLMERR